MSDETTLPKPTPPTTKARLNDQGLVELVDLYTGKVIAIQRAPQDDLLRDKFDNLVKIETEDGPVWIEKSIDPALVVKSRHPKFSKFWADLIAGEILGGATIKAALETHRISQQTHLQWRKNPEYAEIISEAKRARAELFHDEMIDTARSSDPNPAKMKALQWAAEKADPEQYGQKQKVEHSGTLQHTIILDTAIRRDPTVVPEGYEDVIRTVEETNSRSLLGRTSGAPSTSETPQEKAKDVGATTPGQETSQDLLFGKSDWDKQFEPAPIHKQPGNEK